jgi:integrase/recombinase XerD
MSRLRELLGDYLAVRRALGFKLEGQGRLLGDFVSFADRAGAGSVTIELALAWALLPKDVSPGWSARRLRMVGGFALYLKAFDPYTEVPPAGLLVGRNRRPTPYLYCDGDIASLLSAARALSPPLRAATFEALIGLLAVTGLRPGEAIGLDKDDIDWDTGLLSVRDAKLGGSRILPLHPSTVEALKAYAGVRDLLCPQPGTGSFFVSTRGATLARTSIYSTFHHLLSRVGLQPSSARRPRLHDFRHSFAVKTLLCWLGDSADVGARMPLLSTYLGHTNPAATFWYLTASPELLGAASEALERARGQRP